MEEEIQELKTRIEALESFVSERRSQQLQYPLDAASEDIVKEKKLLFERDATGTITADKTIVISINGKLYQINAL